MALPEWFTLAIPTDGFITRIAVPASGFGVSAFFDLLRV
jgi:hypothetical protein